MAADHVTAGDVLDIDGIRACVTGRRGGVYWIGGHLQAGVALDWHQPDGSASGIRD